ncbi:hypothetical protein SLA2020_284940 [Shorea laevis]
MPRCSHISSVGTSVEILKQSSECLLPAPSATKHCRRADSTTRWALSKWEIASSNVEAPEPLRRAKA